MPVPLRSPLATAASLAAMFAGVPASAASPGVPELGTSKLDRELAAVLPSASENRWMEVPWRTNLAEALAEGARTNKPILLWVMNGNPLGCG